MLTSDQRALWRTIVILYVATGLIIGITLIFDIRIGFVTTYFRGAYDGEAPKLLHPESVLDYGLSALLVILAVLPRMFLAFVCIALMGKAFIPADYTTTNAILQLLMMGGVASLMLIDMSYFYTLFYASDDERATFVLLIKVCNFLYSVMYQLSLGVIFVTLLRRRIMPRNILYPATAILIAAFAYSMIAHHPNFTQFFGALIAYIAGLFIIVYMALVLNSGGSPTRHTPATK